MFYKYSNNEEPYFDEVDLAKRNNIPLNEPLLNLFPCGRPIDKLKLKDLNDILPFIPPVRHEFYKNLKPSNPTDDFGIFGEYENDDL